MSSDALDCVVVGAGVVGLAVARELAERGLEVVVVEREARAGDGVSSRNSGVIHAGLYYPPGSLKAELCVRGRALLYRYCEAHGIPHSRQGKWVVATSEAELPALRALQLRAADNGLGELRWCDAHELAEREPALQAMAALDVPQTGIVDVAELVMALAGDLQQRGGVLATHVPVERVVAEGETFAVFAKGESGPLRCRRLVNAAGLGAITLALATEGLDRCHIPTLHYCAGHYYRTHRPVPFKRLVYPLPGVSGLGVHLGFDGAGLPRFGPDVRFLDREDYRFDDSQRAAFAEAIRTWWPVLRDEDLLPDFVGIRPKLVGPGEANPDFVVQDEETHGLHGLINLFGIESPGLTASLALAERVTERLVAGF